MNVRARNFDSDASDNNGVAFARQSRKLNTRGIEAVAIGFYPNRELPQRMMLTVGTRDLEISVPDSIVAMPWFYPMMESLCKRWGAHRGWDSYDAEPTNEEYVKILLTNILPLMQPDSIPPIITPLTDGGVQAEWDHNGKMIEIEVSSSGAPTYFFSDEGKVDADEEGLLKDHFGHIRELIASLKA